MTIGDIWRAATVVKTFNDIEPGKEKFSEWVVVTHYRTDTGTDNDTDASLAITSHQATILQTPVGLFAGNTRITSLKAVNLTTSFVFEQVVSLFIGDAEKRPLPPQVALGVFGRGSAIGRRAMKFYSSLHEDLLGPNGVLIFTIDTEQMKGLAFSDVVGIFGSVYKAGVFGATEIPDFVRSQRRLCHRHGAHRGGGCSRSSSE
ncbi:hypothetical protein LCGC14_2306910, partial [marine sediment metagenome]